jgi:muconolactone delta-isomerase
VKIIAHLTFSPDADIQAFLAIRAEEAAMVWKLYKAGTIREAALRTDLSGAVLTFEAESEDEVRALLADFPAVKAGLFKFELIGVGPFLSWETLFAGEPS